MRPQLRPDRPSRVRRSLRDGLCRRHRSRARRARRRPGRRAGLRGRRDRRPPRRLADRGQSPARQAQRRPLRPARPPLALLLRSLRAKRRPPPQNRPVCQARRARPCAALAPPRADPVPGHKRHRRAHAPARARRPRRQAARRVLHDPRGQAGHLLDRQRPRPPEPNAVRRGPGLLLSRDRDFLTALRQHSGNRETVRLCVGSGVVEARCKVIVGSRLKGPEMHWSVNGANAILACAAVTSAGASRTPGSVDPCQSGIHLNNQTCTLRSEPP